MKNFIYLHILKEGKKRDENDEVKTKYYECLCCWNIIQKVMWEIYEKFILKALILLYYLHY